MSSYPRLIDGVGSPQSVFQTTTNQKHMIGVRGELDDGRVFHYASHVANATIASNNLAQMPAPSAATEHTTVNSTPTGVTAVDASESLKTITVTLGNLLSHANQYQNGLLKIESATTGAGQTWLVNEHAAVLASGILTFQTKDPVLVAVTGGAAVNWSLIHNPWSSVVAQPAAVTAPAAGVVLVTWPAASATAPVFGWVQTWGMCSVLSDNSAWVAGHSLSHENNNVVGSVAVSVESDIVQRIGVAMEAITTTGYGSAFLQIAP